MQYTILVDDADAAKPWTLVCEACGVELDHDPAPQVHLFRVPDLAAATADPKVMELLQHRFDMLAAAMPGTKLIVVDADVEHVPPPSIETRIREHAKVCTRSRAPAAP